MLYEFLTTHRNDLINRCLSKVAQRHPPKAGDVEYKHGISLFLDQLIKTLEMEQMPEPLQSRRISGPDDGIRGLSEIGTTATRHGSELSQNGFTIDEVVHDYGDLCQAITNLAFETGTSIEIDEFRTLNRCLDNGIADAVKEFACQRDAVLADHGVQAMNERMGFLAHELRNDLNTVMLAVAVIKAGNVGLKGATGELLDRSLKRLEHLINRSIADVRVTADMPARHELISLNDFISQIKTSASLDANARQCQLVVTPVDSTLAIDVDSDLLFSAVGNLLQNAFKFTRPATEVSLHAYAAADRVRIDIEDHCGGLPKGLVERMFAPFVQGGEDKSGLGLGLAICRRSVEANKGVCSVRDVPGSGCIFTIDLPRHLFTSRKV